LSDHLLTLEDLSDADVGAILAHAHDLASRPRSQWRGARFSAALLFLQPSLRTRVGFAEAALRLGGAPIDVTEQRGGGGMSASEDFADTLRVLSGMVDIVVCRTPFALDRAMAAPASRAPLVNGGDGANAHPTQALIDLFALQRRAGGVDGLAIGVSGDLATRAARSLLAALGRFPPARLRLMAPAGRDDPGAPLAPALERVTERAPTPDFRDLDVLYLSGLAAGVGAARLDADARAPYAFTAATRDTLAPHAIVLCPLPCIDEADAAGRADRRFAAFAQSDDGVAVRAAVLHFMLHR
jgi:aspartate carbamoyltransferase catalytic subunit